MPHRSASAWNTNGSGAEVGQYPRPAEALGVATRLLQLEFFPFDIQGVLGHSGHSRRPCRSREVDHDRIGCTVAAGDAEVNRDLRIVHMDGVRAAERLKGDVLDVVEVEAGPFAVRRKSICSAMLAPLNSACRTRPGLRRCRCRSPGFQTKVSSPAPISATSLPVPPDLWLRQNATPTSE